LRDETIWDRRNKATEKPMPHRQMGEKRTLRNLPYASFADCKSLRGNRDLDLAGEDEKEHVHFPGIFGPLEASGRDIDSTTSKEGQS
jgi:hypothetical protein